MRRTEAAIHFVAEIQGLARRGLGSGIEVLPELEFQQRFLCLRHPVRRGGLGHPRRRELVSCP